MSKNAIYFVAFVMYNITDIKFLDWRPFMKDKKMIATQIDLARRKENKAQICAFLDHIAKFGYNTVFFYLEDRIKTKSYPYAKDEESYTPDEMRELVAYAGKLGIEVIPVVSNQSHTERFLSHEELLPMAELYGNIKGRFNEAGNAYYHLTCTENPLTYEFFNEYYREISEIFPSKYFHVGLDEGFDIASCERCKARFLKEGNFDGIFLDHVKRTNDVIRSLGKTMMLWDDMFHLMEDSTLKEVPKDVIMVSWNYDYIDRAVPGQFRNNYRRELFREYDRLGIKYIPACWSNFDYNIDTLTALGERFSPMGYLATTWQMSPEPLIYNYISLAYAGLLWNGILTDDPDARLKKAVRETVGGELTDGQAATLGMIATKVYANRAPRHFYMMDGTLVRRNVNFDEENKLDRMLYDAIKDVPLNNKFVDFYKGRIKNSLNFYRQYVLAQKLYDYLCDLIDIDKDKLVSDLSALRDDFLLDIENWDEEWKIYREGIPADYVEDGEVILADMDKLIEWAKSAEKGQKGALDMYLLLPDKSVRALTELSVEYEDGTAETLGKGLYKPYATSCYNIAEKGPYVYNVTFLTAPKPIRKFTVSVRSFGSQYINFFAQRIGKDTYVPESVDSFGKVQNPDRLLTHDNLPCEIGEGNMMLPFKTPSLADDKHGVKVTLIKD